MDSPVQETKSVLSEAIDLRMALQDILGMIRVSETTLSNENKVAVPQSSLKLDNLRNTLLDCKELTSSIGKGLRLLV
jgi:hypothetical protein